MGLLAAGLVAGGIVALILTRGGNRRSTGAGGESGGATSEAGGAAARPNIVFVLTDDLSMNLVQFMPHVLAMERAGLTRHTFPLAMQRAGYATALMGKFLNGYLESSGHGHVSDGEVTNVPARYVPPGFTDWDVAGWGYPEFNYTLNQDGVLHGIECAPSPELRRAANRRASVARRSPATDPKTDRKDQLRLPASRAIGAGGRPDDRNDGAHARSGRDQP